MKPEGGSKRALIAQLCADFALSFAANGSTMRVFIAVRGVRARSPQATTPRASL
jgi:hypothetical protein